ncbi:hypothetical protein [Microlunatus sp. GCM10028923]|uniref:hypothetical protein n=1 Tax=Microlunatus sp. GCM10028923 TaxID=3273400 RepID=UPI0036242046
MPYELSASPGLAHRQFVARTRRRTDPVDGDRLSGIGFLGAGIIVFRSDAVSGLSGVREVEWRDENENEDSG